MISEDATLQGATDLTRPWRTARSRSGLRPTATERIYLLVLVDLILVNSSLVAAVTIWNRFPLSLPAMLANFKWFITLSILWATIGTILDVYSLVRSASITSIVLSVGLAALLSAGIYLAIPWLTPRVLARSYAIGFVLLTTLTLVAWRAFYTRALVQPAFRRRVLILGEGDSAHALMRALMQAGQAEGAHPFHGTGYLVVGLVADRPTRMPDRTGDIPLLGDARQLVRLARQKGVDEVVVALDDKRALSSEVYEALLDCRELGLQISTLDTIYEHLTGRLPVDYARRDLDLLLGPLDNPGSRLYTAVKRLVDIFLALLGLVVLAQVIPWVVLGNAIWSRGPIFFWQQRLGKGGKPFALLKFRTMIPDAEGTTGAVWCGEKDPRITPVGRWLRKTRLDELPQLINVLRGEMSIVGPRPERPHFVGQLSHALPLYRARHAVKPGITGWAQVRYRYGNSVEDGRVKLEYDLYYVNHAGFYLDLTILLQTVRVILGLRGQ